MNEMTKDPHPIRRRDVLKIYNKINQEIYEIGISKHKIEFSENRLMIFAVHKRIAALKVMRKNFPELVSYANTAIFSEFKTKLKEELEQLTGLSINTVLMDYDATTQQSCTIVYFDVNICEG
ncbi:MAG TPA: Na-translocating system protein MpsC family protein [Bacillota bacterium]|nr:Na-translocating system protein MpsC family protein [Bacillota bacterium]